MPRELSRAVVAALFATVVLAGCRQHASQPPPGKIPITTASREALAEYVEGRRLLEMWRATDALQHFQRAVELDPSFALAWWGLANASASPREFLSDLERAVSLADRASAGEAALIRATEAAVNADPEGQAELLARLVRDYPDDERAHFQLGTFYFGQQRWQEAITEYEKAIAIDPEYPPPYNHLGYCLRNLERYEDAERAFRTYAELIPDEPNPHDSYAEMLMKLGRFSESIAEYEKALEINPNFTASYVGLGNNQIFLGRPDEALNTFARLAYIARNDGERRQALVWMAAAYIYERDFDGALAELDKRRAIAADAGDLLSVAGDDSLRGRVLLEAGRPADALVAFDRALKIVEKAHVTAEVSATFRRNGLYNQARVALAQGDLAHAEELTSRLQVEVGQHRVPGEERALRELLGRLAMARGEWTDAVVELQQADQQNPQVLYLLAQAYEAGGNLEQARVFAARAAHFNGLSFVYAFVRGDALALLERLERSSRPAGAAVPVLPRPARSVAVA